MSLSKTLYVRTRDQWRAWLARHYQSETEIWLIYYKKHSEQPRIPYEHAVEEALCFGWIDSIVKKIDDDKFAQKFTPRRDSTKWSALNRRRVRRLIQEGRMTQAGLAKIDPEILGEAPPVEQGEELDIPRFLKQALKASPKAWESFERLAPSHRKQYIRWITDAKKEETRERRLREAVALLEQDLEIPGFFKQALKASAKAWKYFQSLPPSERRRYIRWIMHATQAQTRERRLREAVALLEQNKKLGLK
jgi:uncharacterized protein YdeI (YjbR/CyaY-like superfamily)